MSQSKQGPNWELVNPQADWQARDSQGEFVFDDHLWILGGWFTPQTPNPRDVWKSPDGLRWSCVNRTAPWEHSDLPVALVHRDRMWLMGGRKLPGTDCSNKVWSSTDGEHWRLEAEAAGWSPRVAPGFAVFRDRMWVMGGTESFYDHSESKVKNDVWSSPDGREWTLMTPDAGWSRRAHFQVLAFDGKLWVLGGGLWHPEHVARNDVWCSEDGRRWEQVTAAAGWAPRLWFAAAVYRGRMWVMGGWSKEHGNFGDVWTSKDGRGWSELRCDTIWKSRHEHSAFVFKDRIWIAGGEANPLDSEVWSLELPQGWFGDE